jgi:hypothetical protein
MISGALSPALWKVASHCAWSVASPFARQMHLIHALSFGSQAGSSLHVLSMTAHWLPVLDLKHG